MNDNINKEQASTNGSMGHNWSKMCGHPMCCGGRHFWLRWLLGIVILAIVFCLGVKVGEFKGAFGGGFGRYGGYNMMRYYQQPERADQFGQPWGMMQFSAPATAQPNTSTTTPKK